MNFLLKVKETIHELLKQEDTDGDKKITTEDQGPRMFKIASVDGKRREIRGTYFLSNLLQELALAKNKGLTEVEIPLSKIEEAPSSRISRMIREVFWDDLTRTIDETGIARIVGDDKAESDINRVYVPYSDEIAQKYYKDIAQDYNIDVIVLPENVTPEYVKTINNKPGILSLQLENGKGVPFVVPGGRFNEMYGWDSYFEGIGLLLDGRIDLAKAMVDNFCYQIQHYGKILNANRSYYLTRTQPPFLSSFIREVYEHDFSISKEWLKEVLEVAIREYETVWMVLGKRLTENGLNRYYAEGIGIPPETEEGHFDDVLSSLAKVHSMSVNKFVKKYQSGELEEPKLDTYFTHDRSLRESGHDTSWRLDDVCADLNTVDLNSLLYKYETDFGYLIDTCFNGDFESHTSNYWFKLAEDRAKRMYDLMWNEQRSQFFDYNIKTNTQTYFESASNYFPLWAGLVKKQDAKSVVESLITELKEKGGIAGTSQKMNDNVPEGAVQRQWDYPNGWAPHQMMIWRGLKNYGFEKETQELIYRWLWMITINAVNYNGTIPEKYDVVACTHKVYAEYGNVGTEFDYITTSGFGWMNASYQYGLSLLDEGLRDKLDELTDPEEMF
ncbi:MAG: trehalase [Flavobacteriaceae bacterium]|nr:trehalase [Bacteroidia bacterium]NND10302.1 trehalase [Flavobacteriaceae bacterium]NNL60663.1 trehalase [Flavobacteriaceae bacterium]RZV69057.1 MAG: trehalase [Flavobacteriaceae bacterium]